MAYNTIAELIERYTTNEITELSSSINGEMDESVVSQAIEDADAEIDIYLNAKYDTPIAEPIPGIIKKLSAVIAYLNLNHRRNIWSEELQSLRGWCDKQLKNLSDGTIVPDIAGNDNGTGSVMIESEELRGW